MTLMKLLVRKKLSRHLALNLRRKCSVVMTRGAFRFGEHGPQLPVLIKKEWVCSPTSNNAVIRPELKTAWHPPYSRCRSSTWRASNAVKASNSVRKTARCTQCGAMRHVLRNTERKCECEDVSSKTEVESTEQQDQRVFSRDDCHEHPTVLLGLTNPLGTPSCPPGKNTDAIGELALVLLLPSPVNRSVKHVCGAHYIGATSTSFCCTRMATFPIVLPLCSLVMQTVHLLTRLLNLSLLWQHLVLLL